VGGVLITGVAGTAVVGTRLAGFRGTAVVPFCSGPGGIPQLAIARDPQQTRATAARDKQVFPITALRLIELHRQAKLGISGLHETGARNASQLRFGQRSLLTLSLNDSRNPAYKSINKRHRLALNDRLAMKQTIGSATEERGNQDEDCPPSTSRIHRGRA